jgi:hypothetical protein
MQTHELRLKPDPLLDHLLDQATAALIHARTDYETLESDDGADQRVVAAAWLQLWRAQERHRQLSAQFEWVA